jgi:hypothetical protein
MTPPVDDAPVRDPELQRLLEEWKAPSASDSLDRRILASYRAHVRPRPLWRRFFTASVRVPLPVAIAAALVFVFALWGARPRTAPLQSAATLTGLRQASQEEIRVVSRASLAGFMPVEEMSVSVVPPAVTP